MAINLEKKSNRLLGGRRFTSADLNASQEAFASVLDIRASEVYTQASLIPTGSLPFSGSSQSGKTFTSGSGNKGIMKYYFRQKLTPSNVEEDVFFFSYSTSPPHTGSAAGITPQLIDSNQQGNFISPKYSDVSLANANAEDSTPGYNVQVLKSTSTNSGSLGSGDVVSTNDYQFDYKTGVLQFETALSSNVNVYMTAYQYVGETLADGLTLSGTGSFDSLEANTLTLGTSTFNSDGSDVSVTGSSFVFKATDSSDLLTLRNDNDELVLQVDDKVVVLGAKTGATPTAVAGGLYYSGSDHWFLGFEGSGLP